MIHVQHRAAAVLARIPLADTLRTVPSGTKAVISTRKLWRPLAVAVHFAGGDSGQACEQRTRREDHGATICADGEEFPVPGREVVGARRDAHSRM